MQLAPSRSEYLLALLFAALVLCFAILSPCPAFYDADIGWHTATGMWMRDHLQIPQTDMFSFATEKARWFNFSILPDLAMSWLYALNGFAAQFTAAVLICAPAIFLTTRNVQKTGAGFLATCVVMFCVTVGMHAVIFIRPQLVTYLLLPIFYALLARHRTQADYLVFWIVPLTILWANSHAGFLIGFTLIGAFVVEAFVAGLAARPPHRRMAILFLLSALCILWLNFYVGVLAAFAVCVMEVLLGNERRGKILVAVGVLAVLASLINPYGYEIYTAARGMMKMEMAEYTEEWTPFSVVRQLEQSLCVFLLLFFGKPLSPRIPLADKLLAMGWWLLGLHTSRYVPVATLLSAPFLARSLELTFTESIYAAKLQSFSQRCTEGFRGWIGIALTGSLLAIGLAFVGLPALHGHYPGYPPLPKPHMRNPAAMDYIFTHHPNARLMATYNSAGYVILENYQRCLRPLTSDAATTEQGEAARAVGVTGGGFPLKKTSCNVQVFVDGRINAVYPPEVLADYIAFTYKNSRGWEEIFDRYHINLLLLEKQEPLYQRFPQPPRWDILYEDDYHAVIGKKENKNE